MPSYKNRFHFDNNFLVEPIPIKNILLYQIGERSCGNAVDVPVHKQFCYELTCVISGTGVTVTNDVSTPLKEGDIYISLPDEIHYIHSDEDTPLRFFYCGFRVIDNPDYASILDEITIECQKNNRLIKSDGIFGLLKKGLAEISDGKKHYLLMLESCILNIIIAIYRRQRSISVNHYVSEIKIMGSDIAYHLIRYIDQNIMSIKSAMELSKIFNYNYSYLSRMFKQTTKTNLKAFLTTKKIQYAKKLLEAGDSVTKAALKLNYTSIHVFTKTFKQCEGISPQQYKLQVVQKEEAGDEL